MAQEVLAPAADKALHVRCVGDDCTAVFGEQIALRACLPFSDLLDVRVRSAAPSPPRRR